MRPPRKNLERIRGGRRLSEVAEDFFKQRRQAGSDFHITLTQTLLKKLNLSERAYRKARGLEIQGTRIFLTMVAIGRGELIPVKVVKPMFETTIKLLEQQIKELESQLAFIDPWEAAKTREGSTRLVRTRESIQNKEYWKGVFESELKKTNGKKPDDFVSPPQYMNIVSVLGEFNALELIRTLGKRKFSRYKKAVFKAGDVINRTYKSPE